MTASISKSTYILLKNQDLNCQSYDSFQSDFLLHRVQGCLRCSSNLAKNKGVDGGWIHPFSLFWQKCTHFCPFFQRFFTRNIFFLECSNQQALDPLSFSMTISSWQTCFGRIVQIPPSWIL